MVAVAGPYGVGLTRFAELSNAYWRTVSSGRYRVAACVLGTTSDLSTNSVTSSKTWWRCRCSSVTMARAAPSRIRRGTPPAHGIGRA